MASPPSFPSLPAPIPMPFLSPNACRFAVSSISAMDRLMAPDVWTETLGHDQIKGVFTLCTGWRLYCYCSMRVLAYAATTPCDSAIAPCNSPITLCTSTKNALGGKRVLRPIWQRHTALRRLPRQMLHPGNALTLCDRLPISCF